MTSHEIPFSTRVIGKFAVLAVVEYVSKGVIVEGRENLPKKPPYLIAFNHFGWLEGAVPHFLLPIQDWPYIITKIENMKGTQRKLLSPFGVIGIKRGEPDRRALNCAIELLRNGRIVATALEGTRGSEEERLKPKEAKAGLIFLATQFEKPLPIVPIAVWGENEWFCPYLGKVKVRWEDRQYIRREPLNVNIGVPFIPDMKAPVAGMNRRGVRDALTNELQQRILDLLPSGYAKTRG